MKICIHTLGCKVNSYESQQLAEQCRARGHQVVMRMSTADLYIINTCAITGVAETKSRQAVAKAHRLNGSATVLVVGCAGAKDSGQFVDIGVDAVYGTDNRYDVLSHIDRVGSGIEGVSNNTRAFVKIQDGCNRFCSYCIVPYLRGRSVSRSIQDIVAEVDNAGALETVLIGIDISQYGLDNGTTLSQLIDGLSHINTRIRLGSLEPSAITPQLLDSLARVNWCRQVHLSLQSGSDSVLARMNRHYTTQQYFDAVQLLRDRFNNISITTDIIVGFCGETDYEFEQTMQFVNRVKFANVHVFPYSPRQGTSAYGMDVCSSDIVASRVKQLTQAKQQLAYQYLDGFIGSTVDVIAERAPVGSGCGYTDNYMRVCWQGQSAKRGTMVSVKILCRQGMQLYGEVQ